RLLVWPAALLAAMATAAITANLRFIELLPVRTQPRSDVRGSVSFCVFRAANVRERFFIDVSASHPPPAATRGCPSDSPHRPPSPSSPPPSNRPLSRTPGR